ncbi:MAG: hypothetical protein AAF488_02650 [Planctomycetota bacterium]
MSRRAWILALAVVGTLAVPGPDATAADATIEDALRITKELEAEFEKAQEEMYAQLAELRETDDYKKLREARDWQKLRELSGTISKPFNDTWRERIQIAGAPFAYAASEGEILFGAMLIKTRLAGETAPALIHKLVMAHPKSEHILPLAETLRYQHRGMDKAQFEAVLNTLIEHNPKTEVVAHAHFARASSLRRSDDPKAAEIRKASYAKVVELMPEDHILSLKARGPEFAQTRLQIGMEVPDIAGVDLDGTDFKLSDYRGKVIMLDFWGDW